MDNIYLNGRYLEDNPGWHQQDAEWKAGHILKVLQKHHLHPKTICDVGCGSGGVIAELSKSLPDCKFTGLDISSDALRLARKHEMPNVDFCLRDMPHARSDLVMAIDVAEHIEDYYIFLRQLKSKGDYFVFHLPLTLAVVNIFKKNYFIREQRVYGHLHIFSRDTIFSTLGKAGYDVLDWKYTAPDIDRAERRIISQFGKYVRILLRAINSDLAVKLLGGFSIIILAQPSMSAINGKIKE